MSARCDGNCISHSGDVRRVRVTNPRDGYDWGAFNYCETAIEDDRRNGFTVTECALATTGAA